MYCAVHSNDDEYEKWQEVVREAEAAAEADGLKSEFLSGNVGGDSGEFDLDRPSTPPEGEEEFTDDDGTVYKWDRGLRAWVPQVGAFGISIIFYVKTCNYQPVNSLNNTLLIFGWIT